MMMSMGDYAMFGVRRSVLGSLPTLNRTEHLRLPLAVILETRRQSRLRRAHGVALALPTIAKAAVHGGL